MAALLEFSNVACEGIEGLSFTLAAGEARVLQAGSEAGKAVLIDLALGERDYDAGGIHFQGHPLERAEPGQIGWVPADGGLISNLKTWENVTLPLWYHGKGLPPEVDAFIARWLAALGMEKQAWADFMARPAAQLKPQERKLAGLLRGLLQAPALLVVDAALFEGLDQASRQAWAAALETHLHEAGGRALLAVAHGAASLPWITMETGSK